MVDLPRPRFNLDRLRSIHLRGFWAQLSPRQRKIARVIGLVLTGLVAFLFSLHLAFPVERVKGKLIEALSSKYDVTVGSVGRGWLPGEIVFKNLVLRSRPSRPDEKVTSITIDRLEVDLGLDFNLIGAIRKKVAVGIDAELGGGEIEGEIEASSSYVAARFETDSLPLGNIPGLAAAVGLPMTGELDADFVLQLPGAKWRNAEGHIELACNDCTVGDGATKITLSPPRAAGHRRRTIGWGDEARSITVPRLSLGKASARIDISKGIGQIKTFSAESKDGWLKITGRIEFKDPFATSTLPGCMQFRLSDDLKRREPTFGNIEYGISEKVRQPDGSFSVPTRGKLTELRWDPRQKCGGGSTEEEEEAGGADFGRPSLVGGVGGPPSLSPEGPPPGGAAVEPGAVPGAAVVPDEPPPPAPGMSGPPMIGPGQRDAGGGNAPPPPPPQGATAPETESPGAEGHPPEGPPHGHDDGEGAGAPREAGPNSVE